MIFMDGNSIKNILLIDSNDIDSFINCKVLKNSGYLNITIFRQAESALSHLAETDIIYQLILTDNYLPVMDGFEFVEKFQRSDFSEKQGKVCFLYSYMSPGQKEKAVSRNIKMVSKPLNEEKILELQYWVLTTDK
ncbi:MAG: response regulator [Bacteroidota bacterium]